MLRNAQRGLGVKDIPVIFDLPLPLAIKRTEEFSRYVHPLLQAYCAKCHDGHYDGEFQLVPIKSRADRTSDALRANLDATLRLIDPKNPSHSVLLSSTLRPHGTRHQAAADFPGLERQSLQGAGPMGQSPVGSQGQVTRPLVRAGARPAENDEVFAVDRNRSAPLDRRKMPAPTPEHALEAGDSRARTAAVISQDPSDPQEFPIPFAVSGVKPKLPPPKTAAPGPPSAVGRRRHQRHRQPTPRSSRPATQR